MRRIPKPSRATQITGESNKVDCALDEEKEDRLAWLRSPVLALASPP